MPDAQIDNPWQIRPGGRGASATQFALRIETIEGVEPLDNQIGVFPKKTVPDALHEVLFGQPEPNATEIEVAGGDPATVPPIRTYAILDAAKVTNLPEMLEDSELEHRCLFKGQAYDELQNVAPWIVRLEESNSLTRNLLTRSDAPWHLWDRRLGIYIRSCGSLDALWRHFRKFVRIQDDNGKWFYFRFWEPRWLGIVARDMDAKAAEKFLLGIAGIIAIDERDRASVVSRVKTPEEVIPTAASSPRNHLG